MAHGQRPDHLQVNGQITSKGKRVDDGKTDAAIRPIALPDWAVAILRRRKLEQPPNDLDTVFVSRNGTWHFPPQCPESAVAHSLAR